MSHLPSLTPSNPANPSFLRPSLSQLSQTINATERFNPLDNIKAKIGDRPKESWQSSKSRRPPPPNRSLGRPSSLTLNIPSLSTSSSPSSRGKLQDISFPETLLTPTPQPLSHHLHQSILPSATSSHTSSSSFFLTDHLLHQETMELLDLFKLVDRDCGGTIEMTEFMELLHTMNIQPSEAEMKLIFNEIDYNHNNCIEFEEFFIFMTQPLIRGYDRDYLKSLFKSFSGIKKLMTGQAYRCHTGKHENLHHLYSQPHVDGRPLSAASVNSVDGNYLDEDLGLLSPYSHQQGNTSRLDSGHQRDRMYINSRFINIEDLEFMFQVYLHDQGTQQKTTTPTSDTNNTDDNVASPSSSNDNNGGLEAHDLAPEIPLDSSFPSSPSSRVSFLDEFPHLKFPTSSLPVPPRSLTIDSLLSVFTFDYYGWIDYVAFVDGLTKPSVKGKDKAEGTSANSSNSINTNNNDGSSISGSGGQGKEIQKEMEEIKKSINSMGEAVYWNANKNNTNNGANNQVEAGRQREREMEREKKEQLSNSKQERVNVKEIYPPTFQRQKSLVALKSPKSGNSGGFGFGTTNPPSIVINTPTAGKRNS